MKFSLSKIRDTYEDHDPEEDDTTAEEYHQEMMRNEHSHNDYVSFLYQAERALRVAPAMTWAEFVKKYS